MYSGEIESDGVQAVPDVGGCHRARRALEHDAARIGQSPLNSGHEAAQSIQSADRLSELGKPFINFTPFHAKLFVLADGGV